MVQSSIKLSGSTTINTQQTLPFISQIQLARYQQLKPLAEEFRHLVLEIKSALESGATIEHGSLTAELHVRHQRRRLQRYLFAKLGVTPKQVKQLRKTAPLVAYHLLAIVPAAFGGYLAGGNVQPE